MLGIDGDALTMSGDFGTIGFGTLEPGNSTLEEQISFTGLTNNSNGTTTLTGISSVSFVYPYTKTSGLLKTHAGSTTFVISNTSGFYDNLTAKTDDETIDGVRTFTNVPGSLQQPVSGTDLANKDYVLSVVNGGAVSTASVIEPGTAGETLVAGNIVYLKVSDGRWYKALGTTASLVQYVALGIAQGAGTAGNLVTGGVLRAGIDTHQSGGAAGSIAYISNTAIAATTAGTVERAIGQYESTTSITFDPDFFYTPIAGIKAAGAGTVGTPSSTNTFVTASGLTTLAADQSQATQNANTAVGTANTTGLRNKIGQSVISGDFYWRGVTLNKQADTGSFIGTVTIAIQADSGGSPSGVNLASKTITNALWLAYPTGNFSALFSSDLAVVPTTTYWIVVSTSTSDTSNHPNIGTNSAGGYGSGGVKFNNTTDGWVSIATIDLTFSTLSGLGGRGLKDTGTLSGDIANALPVMKVVGKSVSVTTANTAIQHGLGKTPSLVEILYANGSNSGSIFSHSYLDIASGIVTTSGNAYNEASSGWTVNVSAAYSSSNIGPAGNSADAPTGYLSFVAIDENVLVVASTSGTNTYQFIFRA